MPSGSVLPPEIDAVVFRGVNPAADTRGAILVADVRDVGFDEVFQ